MNSATLLVFAITLAVAQPQVSSQNWQTFTSKSGGFTIKAPKGWIPASLGNPATKNALKQIKAKNPDLARMIETGTKTDYDLYLLDISGDISKGANNLNLKLIKNSGVTQAMGPDLAQGIIKGAKLSNSGWKQVTLLCGPATSYWGTVSIATGRGKSTEVKMRGYLIVKGSNVYICSMGTTTEKEKKQIPIFDLMAKSIMIK